MNLQQLLTDLKKTSWFHFLIVGFLLMGLFLLYFKSILFSNSFIAFDGLIPADFKIHPWTDAIFSGYPLLSDPIWDAFYPIRSIIYKVLHLDFNFFIISGYYLMAFFTYCYVYHLTNAKLSGFISALLFAFSGFAIFEIGHAANFIHTICWMPLILLAFEKLKDNKSLFWILVSVFSIAMTIAGGFPQISLAICPVLLSYALLISFQTENQLKKSFFYLLLLLAGYLIAAPITIPTFILSLHSTRLHLTWAEFSTYYVEWNQLLLFNFPYLMGGYYNIYNKIPLFGNWEVIGNHGYIGFLSLIFAGIGVFSSIKKLKPIAYFWLVLSLLSVIVALGPQVKFFYNILYHIPVVNNFRAPERYLFIFSFGVSVLAGMGFQALQLGHIKTPRQKTHVFTLATLFAVFLLGSVFWIYPSLKIAALTQYNFHLPVFYQNPAVVVPAMWILVSLMALFFFVKRPDSWFFRFFAAGVLIAEVLYTAYFSYWHPGHCAYTKEDLANPPAYLFLLRNDLNTSHQRYLKMQLSTDSIGKYVSGNFPLYYNLPSAGGRTPLILSRYANFLDIDASGSYIGPPAELSNNQAINIAGIKYLLTISDPLNKIWFKDAAHFKLKNQIDQTIVYENLKALPRVWFTSKAIILPDDQLLQVIHTGKFSDGTSFDPARVALTKYANFNFEEDKTAKAQIQKLYNNKIVIYTQSQKPEFMVLSDIYYPGWKAYIDGKKSDYYLTDYVYRGIVVPAGNHEIIFKYRPLYLYLSYAIAVLTMLLIFLFYFCSNIRLTHLK